MRSESEPDALIVGAGPAGITTAVILARYGWQVQVLESRHNDSPRPSEMRSGEVLSPQAQRELRQLGLDCDAAPWRLSMFNHLMQAVPGYQQVTDQLPGAASFWQIDRAMFDRSLWALAQGAGVELVTGAHVTDVLLNAGGRVSGLSGRIADRQCSWKSKLVIDASGRHSTIMARLHLRRRRRQRQRAALACFYHYVPETQPGLWEQHFLIAHGTTLKGGQISTGLYRYVLETDLAHWRYQREKQRGATLPQLLVALLSPLDSQLAERFARATPTGYCRAYAPVGYNVVPYRQGGLLQIGDAMGYLDPATGQGVELAVQSGRRAAEILRAAAKTAGYGGQRLGVGGMPGLTARWVAELKLAAVLELSRRPSALHLFASSTVARTLLLRLLIR